jgi:hypothetical protein
LQSGTAVTVAQGGTGQTSYTDGQLLIGNTSGNTLTKATLTAGTNVTITNGNGSITIAAAGGGGSPGGTNTQFQYNNSSAFAGAANLVYNANGPIVSSLGVGSTTPSASGAGIAFPATQSASTDVNTLDDYEEGTFTPTITFGGGSTGITYSTQTGSYTKIGNKVFYFVYIILTSKGSSTGNASMTNMPFTATGSTAYVPAASWLGSMASLSSNLMIRSVTGTTTLDMYQIVSSNYSSLTDANFTNSTLLQVAGFFTTA